MFKKMFGWAKLKGKKFAELTKWFDIVAVIGLIAAIVISCVFMDADDVMQTFIAFVVISLLVVFTGGRFVRILCAALTSEVSSKDGLNFFALTLLDFGWFCLCISGMMGNEGSRWNRLLDFTSLAGVFSSFVYIAIFVVILTRIGMRTSIDKSKGQTVFFVLEDKDRYLRSIIVYAAALIFTVAMGYQKIETDWNSIVIQLLNNQEVDFSTFLNKVVDITWITILFSGERLIDAIIKLIAAVNESEEITHRGKKVDLFDKPEKEPKECDDTQIVEGKCPVCNNSGCHRRKNGNGNDLYLCKRYKNVDVKNKNGKFKFQYVCMGKGVYKKIK